MSDTTNTPSNLTNEVAIERETRISQVLEPPSSENERVNNSSLSDPFYSFIHPLQLRERLDQVNRRAHRNNGIDIHSMSERIRNLETDIVEVNENILLLDDKINNRSSMNTESQDIGRQPPSNLINPNKMAQRSLNTIPQSITGDEKRCPATPITQDIVSTEREIRCPVAPITQNIISTEQGRRMGFGDAMNQYLLSNQSHNDLIRTDSGVRDSIQVQNNDSEDEASDKELSDSDNESLASRNQIDEMTDVIRNTEHQNSDSISFGVNYPNFDPEIEQEYNASTNILNDVFPDNNLSNSNIIHRSQIDNLLGDNDRISLEQLSNNINGIFGNTINTMCTTPQHVPSLPTPSYFQRSVDTTTDRGRRATPIIPICPTVRGNIEPIPTPDRRNNSSLPQLPQGREYSTGLRPGAIERDTGLRPGAIERDTGLRPGAIERDTGLRVLGHQGPIIPQVPIVQLPAIPPFNIQQLKSPEVEREDVHIELPKENPYLRIPRAVLDAIAQERDINLTGTTAQRVEQLYEFDHIMPDWIQSIMNKTIDNFQLLTGTKLYVFGALNGISFEGIAGLQNRDLINYIRVYILITTENHPGRNILPGLVNNLSRRFLEIFAGRLNIPRNNLKFIDSRDLRTAILTNSINHIPNDTIANISQRYHFLTTHKYSNLLDDLYNVSGEDDIWINVARNAPHPMESVILNLDKFSAAQIVDTFGISIPLSFSNDVDRYIRNNIVSYASILTRGNLYPIPLNVTIYMNSQDLTQYIQKLKDTEIWSTIGVYVPYNSRDELVANVVNCIIHPQFMYPTIRSIGCSHNMITVMGSEITDTNIFMICFGTALKYIVYELDDLIGSFYRDTETQAMEFRRPENTRNKFSIQDIEDLRRLLSCFPVTPLINELISKIDEGLIDAKEKIAYDDIARNQLRNFDETTRNLIRNFLQQIFYIGMYMRRWAGPGNPFPLKADTTRLDKNPDGKVTEQLGIGIELIKQMGPRAMEFCMNLKICEYNGQGNIDHGHARFNDEWDGVIKGKKCIRMSSSKFVGTGYHYLRALFRETIPGMDVRAVDRIY